MKAATYIRVSSEAQAEEDKVSLDEQRADIEAYAAQRDYEIVAGYRDVGSGVSRDRPDFQRMQADAMARTFDVIVAWTADRLARSGSAMGDLLEAARPSGVDIQTVKGTFDWRYAELLAAVAKMERENIRDRMSLGKRGAAKRGRIPSSAIPYGYERCKETGKPVVVEAGADVVRRLFAGYASNDTSTKELTAKFEVETGLQWSSGRIHKVLNQTAYIGHWVYGKTEKVKTRDGATIIHQRPVEQHVEISFPRIIDSDLWDKVHAIKDARRRFSTRAERTPYLLAKLVFCDECGSLMSGEQRDENAGYGYRCRGQKTKGLRCRQPSIVAGPQLEGAVWDEACAVLQDPESFWDKMGTEGETQRLVADIETAQKRLDSLQTKDTRAVSLYVHGQIDDTELTRQRRPIAAQIEDTKAHMIDLQARQASAHERQALSDSVSAWAQRIGDGLDALDLPARREVLRQVLEKVTLDRHGVLTSYFVLGLIDNWAEIGVGFQTKARTLPR